MAQAPKGTKKHFKPWIDEYTRDAILKRWKEEMSIHKTENKTKQTNLYAILKCWKIQDVWQISLDPLRA